MSETTTTELAETYSDRKQDLFDRDDMGLLKLAFTSVILSTIITASIAYELLKDAVENAASTMFAFLVAGIALGVYWSTMRPLTWLAGVVFEYAIDRFDPFNPVHWIVAIGSGLLVAYLSHRIYEWAAADLVDALQEAEESPADSAQTTLDVTRTIAETEAIDD